MECSGKESKGIYLFIYNRDGQFVYDPTAIVNGIEILIRYSLCFNCLEIVVDFEHHARSVANESINIFFLRNANLLCCTY